MAMIVPTGSVVLAHGLTYARSSVYPRLRTVSCVVTGSTGPIDR